ncbi:MAG: amidohydrolase family protein, partial [Muribaculaceae bacterium]|nr:amidohydrolase family protein [Muribaculaceae bacterium]
MRIINAEIYTPAGHGACKGHTMAVLRHIPHGEIEIIDGIITYCGPMRDGVDAAGDTLDAKGRAVLPGFVDSHTHMVFGGYRPEEFGWRMRGDSYMSIMNRGGGIVNTMKATREATEDELSEKTRRYIDRMSEMGVT